MDKELASRLEDDIKTWDSTAEMKTGDSHTASTLEQLKEAIEGEMLTEIPDIKWDDVIGLDNVIAMLKEAVVVPLKFPETIGDRPVPRVIWLYGHPGTGKTYVTKSALGDLENVTVFSVSSFTTKQARTRQFVSTLYRLARERRPSIILIDETDRFFWSDTSDVSEAAAEFLHQSQDCKENTGVIVIGHSCKPWQLSAAVRQRADRVGFLSLPDMSVRAQMFKHFLMSTPNNLTTEDCQELGRNSEGFSPSDIMVVVKDAMMEPVREIQRSTHFKKVRGSTPQDPGIMMEGLWAPCQADDPDAVTLTWAEAAENVWCREITMVDVLKCLQKNRASVTADENKMFEDFRANA